ncbi:MAG TPA: OmpA family protein [Paraburkholderia sp.]|uniref:OmpA family protein n=1 Tax=Paraburkholderia sp. TaxID=1926495 RepID=UPI002ED4C023
MSFVVTSVVAASLPNAATACSFSLQYGGKIERNVTGLSNTDRLKLADLLITVRNSAAKDGPVVIYGLADERERDAQATASKRAQSVSDYLKSLGVTASRINIDTKIWRDRSQVPVSERNQIEVEFEPACGPGGCENPCGTTEPKK